jgi:phosphoribosyl 1,2-cyclic phosphodiesterase
MSLFITSLNSGSNGNCYYVGNEHEAVLVDAGISCRETEKRMKKLGLSIQKVKAIFISHEHSDHISGVPVLAKKYNIPVYITPGTLKYLRVNPDEYQIVHFIAYQPVVIGELTITAFPKFHDAIEPHSFVVTCRNITVGVFTDIGMACEHLVTHFGKCHAAFLEANYDDEMLDNGGYPYHLKKRIRGGHGHLSNKQALELFVEHKPAFMSHLLLAHLSKNNNSPQLVYDLFSAHGTGTEVIVASRYEETAVYYISGEAAPIATGGRAKQLAFEL